MMNIGWRMDGLVSSCCHCLIKFHIFTLNSVLIFANKLKCFEITHSEYSYQPCNCTLYISLNELSTSPNTF